MPIIFKTSCLRTYKNEPATEAASPPKHSCRARCLRSLVAPLRCQLSSDGGKITKIFWNGNVFLQDSA